MKGTTTLERTFPRTEDDLEEDFPQDDGSGEERLNEIRREVQDLLSAGQAAIERGLANAISLRSVEQTNAQ
jgi:hypothetical protein